MVDPGEFVANIARFEGKIAWLYLDSVGLVTVGVGNYLRSAAEALKLPFMFGDQPATTRDIGNDYARVARMVPNKPATFYRAATSVMLRDEDIDALLLRRLESEFIPGLERVFPGFDGFPAQAQSGVLDMAFNLGLHGLESKFPHFCAAVRAQDWKGAAANCSRSSCRPERNKWTIAQFNEAGAPLVG